jgi:hypothetical protein
MHAIHVVELAAGIYQVYSMKMTLKGLKHVDVTYSFNKIMIW